jgi:hypothetical protein
MITFGKTSSKPNWLFSKLPQYFKSNDSYKDVNDEGLLERYLQIFCEEVDENISPYIDDLLSITDASALNGITRDNPTELLTHISWLFGNPPDIGTGESYSGDEEEYIILIRYIRQILQTKGTTQCLIYFLAIYGYEIDTLTESAANATIYDKTPTADSYDDSGVYDIGFVFYSDFALVITDKPGTGTKNPTQTWLDNYLAPAIRKFISPIWSNLTSITYI